MAKRRILHKLKLTEISAVDRPCQEGARMTIMKRAPEQGTPTALENRVSVLAKKAEEMSQRALLLRAQRTEKELEALIKELT